jgi:hypothetical protein
MSYDAFKVVHLAGVVIFLGNIIAESGKYWRIGRETRASSPMRNGS